MQAPNSPATNGVFYVRATIPPAENWKDAQKSKRFLIYKSFDELYTDFVDIVFPSYLGEYCAGEAKTKIRMYWHLREGMEAPGSSPEDVWSDYAGVWHFAEVLGTANDNLFAVTNLENYSTLSTNFIFSGWMYSTSCNNFEHHGWVSQDGVLQNYWARNPSISKTSPILGHANYSITGQTEKGRILLANDDSMGDCGELAVKKIQIDVAANIERRSS